MMYRYTMYCLSVAVAIVRRQFTHGPHPEFPRREWFGLDR